MPFLYAFSTNWTTVFIPFPEILNLAEQSDILSIKYSYLTIFVANRTKNVNFKIDLILLF